MQARPEMLQPLMEQLSQVLYSDLISKCMLGVERIRVQTIPPEVLQAIQENQEVCFEL